MAVTALSQLGALSGWETRAVDVFLFFRDRVPSSDIVLVLIDDNAFQALGERQPIDRRYLADMAEFLLSSGARVVGFDVHLRRATTRSDDEALVEVTRRWERPPSGRIVFANVARPTNAGVRPSYIAEPPFSLAVRSLFGYGNAPIGSDGIVRRMLPLLPARDGGWLPSFALAVLAGYEGATADDIAPGLAAGGRLRLPVYDGQSGITRSESVPLAMLANQAWRIDYAGPAGSFTSFPSGALVAMARGGVRPSDDNPFRDKIVLVGASFEEGHEFHPTPVGRMPGVEIQANIVQTLLARRVRLPPPWWLNLTLLTAACVGVALLGFRLRALWVNLLSIAVVATLAALSYGAYGRGYWLDFIAPLIGIVTYRKVSDVLTRRRMATAFGQFVSPDVMARVMRDGVRLGGETRTVTVLISDLRGFTTLSEQLDPTRVSEIVNEYFGAMVAAIMARRGMVQDFVGDGILGVFGAPANDPEHAWHAVTTSVAMTRALEELNARWRTEGRPTLALGVAVNTGVVFAGNVGSPQKKKYAVLGDPVNTAARIEALNKELGTTILISAATLAAVRERVTVKARGVVRVTGREEPVELYELVGCTQSGDAVTR